MRRGAACLLLVIAATASCCRAQQSQDTGSGAGAAAGGVDGLAVTSGLASFVSPDARYQEEVLQKCGGIWPEHFRHGYAHYDGDLVEEFFFKWWMKRRPALPQTYLPIGWSTYFFSAKRVQPFNLTEVARATAQVESLLAGLDRDRSYFSVVQFAGLIREEQLAIPCDLKLTLFVGGGPEDLLQAPQLKLVPIPLLLKVLKPARRRRKKLVTFAGGFLEWQDPGGIRSEMRDTLQNLTGYYVNDRAADWEALMHDSVYHLCPRGHGPTSYRLYEALQADTIPIYIWEHEKWLAFEDLVDWNSIALIIPRSEMASIPERVNNTDAAAIRANIGRIRGVWRYNNTSAYIIKRIAATAMEEGLNTYRANSSACAAAALAGHQVQGDGSLGDDGFAGDMNGAQLILDSSGSADGSRGGGIDSETAGSSTLTGELDVGVDDNLGGGGGTLESKDSMHQRDSGSGGWGGMLATAAVLLLLLWVCSRAARRRQHRLRARRLRQDV